MSSITGCDTKPIEKCLREFGLIYLNEISPEDLEGNGKIFINGNFLGIHQDTNYLLRILKLFRRNAYINIFTSFINTVLMSYILALMVVDVVDLLLL